MKVEWECILDCNYKCKYCVNSRNSALPEPIPFEKDKQKVFEFLDSLKEKYKDDELFVFGGEPFLHPFIDEIIEHLNKIEMKFIIQTNFSIYSNIKKCIEKNLEFKVQVSIHPGEIRNPDIYIEELSKLQNIIRRIDIMYIGEESTIFYKKLLKVIKDKSIIFLAPVADFLIKDVVNNQLFRFNELKQGIHGKVFQFEPGERSFIWESQQRGITSMKFQPCIYKDSYILFDPMLRSYNCSYRQNNDICPNDHCFLM
jgi:organic radical activating enzyme